MSWSPDDCSRCDAATEPRVESILLTCVLRWSDIVMGGRESAHLSTDSRIVAACVTVQHQQKRAVRMPRKRARTCSLFQAHQCAGQHSLLAPHALPLRGPSHALANQPQHIPHQIQATRHQHVRLPPASPLPRPRTDPLQCPSHAPRHHPRLHRAPSPCPRGAVRRVPDLWRPRLSLRWRCRCELRAGVGPEMGLPGGV